MAPGQALLPGLAIPVLTSTRRDLWLGVGLAALLLTLYALTMPRTVTLEDSGLFLLVAHSAGIAHPPGYPLYALLGRLFSLLPMASPAVAVHWLSAACGVGTCLLLWRVAYRLTEQSTLSALAALAFGVSLRFWSQAIIAEVYTLLALLFFGCLLALLRAAERPRPWGLVAGHLYGLAVSLHWPLVGLVTPGLLVFGGRTWLRSWRDALVGALLGLWPWGWMVWRSHQSPLIDGYGPIESLAALWFFVSRSGYRSMFAGPEVTVTASERLGFAGFVGHEMLAQFGYLGIILVGLGFWALWKRPGKGYALGLTLAFLGPSFFLMTFAWGTVGFVWEAVFAPFPLLAWGVMGLWLAVGLGWLAERVRHMEAAAAIGLCALVWLHYGASDRSDDTFAHDYGVALLEMLPPDAVLFTHGDADFGAVAAVHILEDVRPDVRVLHDGGLALSDRLFPVGAAPEVKQRALSAFVRRSEHPVFSTAHLDLPEGETRMGLVNRVGSGGPAVAVHEEAERYWSTLAQQVPRDPWSRVVRADLLHAAGAVLGYAVYVEGRREHAPLLDRVDDDWHGMKGVLEACAQEVDPEVLLAWADAMEEDDLVLPPERARLQYLRGWFLLRLGRIPEGIAVLETSAALVPEPGTLRLLEEARSAAER
ncbi:MAG: DUF2723 domain-containing protein [Deltaproteobacteria bacterium]|nr:DUF2723 domain-containing protein [Deltaproteobacteria bacterium]